MTMVDLDSDRLCRAVTPPVTGSGLAADLGEALSVGGTALAGLRGRNPRDRHDRFQSLLLLYDAMLGPMTPPAIRARHAARHEALELKQRLESAWLLELDHAVGYGEQQASDAAEVMRALAAQDRLHATYRWVAREATREELVRFLALEGGPDAGFDDLVAICQVGLDGEPKMELGTNYWDEMGNGEPAAVHRQLHHDLVHAIDMPHVPVEDQPVEGLARAALGGLLATNRWLLPEMVGALGLIELQAGPRCRLVLQGLERVGAPAQALPFYEVHAEVDPRHGRDWLDHVVIPLTAEDAAWVPGIVRGARWRHHVDREFLDAAGRILRAA